MNYPLNASNPQIKMRIHALLKLGSAAVPVAMGASVITDTFDPSSLGIIRFGRAAFTVS